MTAARVVPPGVPAGRLDAVYPVSLDSAHPGAGAAAYLDDPGIRTLTRFFRVKGLAAVKAEDAAEAWYADWIAFQAEHGLYASLLSPRRWSTRGHAFDIRRLTRFLEACAYHSPAHAYSLHVSFLGLFPILTGANDALKQEAMATLESGGLFAFGVSEKAHGSDLLAGDFVLVPADGDSGDRGPWIATGAKYYIGNANTASMMSILAKDGGAARHPASSRSAFAFVAVRPSEARIQRSVAKIRTLGIRAAFVGAFEVHGHRVPAGDLIARGRDAWDAVFRTVDLGKFFLGFGAIGLCERAMTEALAHLHTRILYGHPVIAMPHIRDLAVDAFARLVAMKLFATRALEYLQAAHADDRRYLLYNAVQKARVTTEAVRVLGLLSECIGARAAESDTFFEMALRDAQLIPELEGSTHINLEAAVRFTGPYFAGAHPGEARPVFPPTLVADPGENPYLLESHDRKARAVRFAPPLDAYTSLLAIPNVRLFAGQVEAYGRFASGVEAGGTRPEGTIALAMGKCLAAIAYAQLVAEQCVAARVESSLVSVMFRSLVEDLGAESLKLAAALDTRGASHDGLAAVVRVPRTDAADVEAVSAWMAARYPAADAA